MAPYLLAIGVLLNVLGLWLVAPEAPKTAVVELRDLLLRIFPRRRPSAEPPPGQLAPRVVVSRFRGVSYYFTERTEDPAVQELQRWAERHWATIDSLEKRQDSLVATVQKLTGSAAELERAIEDQAQKQQEAEAKARELDGRGLVPVIIGSTYTDLDELLGAVFWVGLLFAGLGLGVAAVTGWWIREHFRDRGTAAPV